LQATKWGPAHPPTSTPKMRLASLRERGREAGLSTRLFVAAD
jgi:hypothetical protein